MRAMVDHVQQAIRRMRREPGFLAFAAVIVGLGVAATTAVFSVMSPLMLRPLPFREPARLVWIARASTGGMSDVTSRAFNLRDYRTMARSFESITGYFAFFEYTSYNLVGDGTPERLVGVDVARNFLPVLGVAPQLGRNFVEEEDGDHGRAAVILTHRFWVRRFAADPHIVGRAITLNDTPTTVVGVLPASFDFASTFAPTSRVDFLKPFPITEQTNRWGNTLSMIGRLRPGVTVQAAQAELDRVNAQLLQADRSRWGLQAVVSGLRDQIAGGFRPALRLLAAGALLVLVVACANLSNLLLARGQQRAREMSVRSALGATRERLLGQLLVESVLLAAGGGALGVLLAWGITRWVAGASAVRIPLLESVSLDPTALAFTLVVTLLTGLVVGIVPALQASRGREASTLRDVGRGATEGGRRTAFRELLVVGEVAVACLLLVVGGLLLRSFVRVTHVDLGFQPDGIVAWQLHPSHDFPNDAARFAYFDDVVSRVRDVPGVRDVGFTDTPPLGRNRTWTGRGVGETYPKDEQVDFLPRIVSARYLQTMRIPLVAGRYLAESDRMSSHRAVVINEAAAKAFFQGKSAVGRQAVLTDTVPWDVIGVVGNVRHQSLEAEASPEVYIPYGQFPWVSTLVMVVRTPLPASSIAGGVRGALRAVDVTMPSDDYQAFESVIDRALSPRRFILVILGAFAGTALLLEALGIYAVLSYTVSQRVREIGIRMALGESAAAVRRRVVRRTIALAGTGIAIGAAFALVVTRLIASLLYGVATTDTTTFVGTGALLLAVAALAGYVPARRASRTDPNTALRAT